MTAITIVPEAGSVGPDQLTVEVCRDVIAEVLHAFDAVDMPASVGAIDVSFNEDDTGELPAHWCVHSHVVALDWPSKNQNEGIRKRFPKSFLIARPVNIVPLDLQENGRLYPVKADRIRRISYVNLNNPTRAPFRNTRSDDLRAWQSVTLAKVEHELGFEGRLITHAISLDAVKSAMDGFYWAQDGP